MHVGSLLISFPPSEPWISPLCVYRSSKKGRRIPSDLRVMYYCYAEGSTDSILGVEVPVCCVLVLVSPWRMVLDCLADECFGSRLGQ